MLLIFYIIDGFKESRAGFHSQLSPDYTKQKLTRLVYRQKMCYILSLFMILFVFGQFLNEFCIDLVFKISDTLRNQSNKEPNIKNTLLFLRFFYRSQTYLQKYKLYCEKRNIEAKIQNSDRFVLDWFGKPINGKFGYIQIK